MMSRFNCTDKACEVVEARPPMDLAFYQSKSSQQNAAGMY